MSENAPTAPSDITASSIDGASLRQLKCWIDEANRDAVAAGGSHKRNKRVLLKSGNSEALKDRLVKYYGIDRSVKEEAPAGPVTLKRDIQTRQWAWLCQLGDEWYECSSQDKEFKLTPYTEGVCSVSIVCAYHA